MPNCSVYSCKNRSDASNLHKENITFHVYPKDPTTRYAWIRAAGNSSKWVPTSTSTICSQHFENSCFILLSNNTRRLTKTAVPTLKLSEYEIEIPPPSPSSSDLDESLQFQDTPREKRFKEEIKILRKKSKNYQRRITYLRSRLYQVKKKYNEPITADDNLDDEDITKLLEGRGIVATVHRYLQYEYNQLMKHFGTRFDFSVLANFDQRTAAATGVSERMVAAIVKAYNNNPVVEGKKKRVRHEENREDVREPMDSEMETLLVTMEDDDDVSTIIVAPLQPTLTSPFDMNTPQLLTATSLTEATIPQLVPAVSMTDVNIVLPAVVTNISDPLHCSSDNLTPRDSLNMELKSISLDHDYNFVQLSDNLPTNMTTTQDIFIISDKATEDILSDKAIQDILSGQATQVIVDNNAAQDILVLVDDRATNDILSDNMLSDRATQSNINDKGTHEFLSDKATEVILSDKVTGDILGDKATAEILSDISTQDILNDNAINDILSDIATRDILDDIATQDILSEKMIQDILSDKATQDNLSQKVTQAI